jgi:Geranylgeranyl pyrophosphate synthase
MQPFLCYNLKMKTLDSIKQRVDLAVSQLHFANQPESLYSPIEYILSLGGKRIRPVLSLIVCDLYSDDIEPVINPALGIEVFHNFTLLHDDLMDAADKRRNKPTVHKVWNANTAILSGDAMLIVAYQLISKTPSEHLKEVLSLFTTTALEICGGQQYDMLFENRLDVTEDEYLEMIRLKTAVLLACSLKTGAIVGGASDKDASLLYDFGINLGLAFQLQDDLLDVYGDPEIFGKNVGGDILCNKKTYLLINALKNANTAQRERLVDWINKEHFSPEEKIAYFTKMYLELGIKELAENKIKYYYTEAVKCLSQLSVCPSQTQLLKTVCEDLMNRDF